MISYGNMLKKIKIIIKISGLGLFMILNLEILKELFGNTAKDITENFKKLLGPPKILIYLFKIGDFNLEE